MSTRVKNVCPFAASDVQLISTIELKGHCEVVLDYIYSINEIIIQTQKYIFFLVTE